MRVQCCVREILIIGSRGRVNGSVNIRITAVELKFGRDLGSDIEGLSR